MTSSASDTGTRRSPLAFVILALLAEAPMHAYRMQRLIKERGKDEVVNIAQRNSIHQTVNRLHRDGLVETRETRQENNRPPRTVYGITGEGSALFAGWMREMLSRPAREFPEFPAALSFLGLFSCAEVSRDLKARAVVLERRLEELCHEATELDLPRVFLIEEEYVRATTEAELNWVRSVIVELDSGQLSWDTDALRASASEPDE